MCTSRFKVVLHLNTCFSIRMKQLIQAVITLISSLAVKRGKNQHCKCLRFWAFAPFDSWTLDVDTELTQIHHSRQVTNSSSELERDAFVFISTDFQSTNPNLIVGFTCVLPQAVKARTLGKQDRLIDCMPTWCSLVKLARSSASDLSSLACKRTHSSNLIGLMHQPSVSL